jgi:hypothetical protein
MDKEKSHPSIAQVALFRCPRLVLPDFTDGLDIPTTLLATSSEKAKTPHPAIEMWGFFGE